MTFEFINYFSHLIQIPQMSTNVPKSIECTLQLYLLFFKETFCITSTSTSTEIRNYTLATFFFPRHSLISYFRNHNFLVSPLNVSVFNEFFFRRASISSLGGEMRVIRRKKLIS